MERWFLAKLRARAFAHLPIKGRILELGAGTGVNFSLYSNGVSVIATDASGEMLKIARHKSSSAHLQIVQSPAEKLPFRQNSFDAAVATLVFCSVESPEEAFFELQRVVKPGGVLVMVEHVRPRGVLGPVFDLLSLLTTSAFADRFNRRTSELAQGAGLEVLTREERWLGIMNLLVCRVR